MRRILLGVSVVGTATLVRGAITPPASPVASAPPSAQNHPTTTELAGIAQSIVVEAVALITDGGADTATAATPCTGGYTPTGNECSVATPVSTPVITPSKVTTPVVTKVVTPRPSSTTTSGGSTGGGGGGGSSSGSTVDCGSGDPSTDPLAVGADCAKAGGTSTNLFGSNGLFQVASNTLIYLVGAISVVFLIIGGLRYVISQGDAKATAAAKNTILYAIIGIIIAVVSFALINFVINALSKTG